MSKSLENILKPNEAFKEYLPTLLSVYGEDYGRKDLALIKNRINNTLYIFDSNPLDMMAFLIENYSKINDPNIINQITTEYDNYINLKCNLSYQLNNDLLKELKKYFDIPKAKLNSKILNLDFASYSLHNISKLRNPNTTESERQEILNRQEDYCNKCRELGIEPLTNYIFISFYLEKKERLEKQMRVDLFKKSLWGKRIIKTIKKYNPLFTLEEIYYIIESTKVATTNHLLSLNGLLKGIVVYYPLVSNRNREALDEIMFHENRHVIESTEEGAGLTLYSPRDQFKTMDEIRVEGKALADKEALENNLLWSNDLLPNAMFNPYEIGYNLTEDFFTANEELLNRIGLYGKQREFKSIFGEENLLALENYLKDLEKRLTIAEKEVDMDEETIKAHKLVKTLVKK